MKEKILVPALGESIVEATVSKWLKSEGDAVEADEPIVELESDNVNLEVPSPITGVLTEINSKDGSVVEVGALLGSVSENGSGVQPIPKKNEEVKKGKIEFRVEKNGIIHTIIGKTSFDKLQLAKENERLAEIAGKTAEENRVMKELIIKLLKENQKLKTENKLFSNQ